jgi:dihydrolipoamide dehydrogenase
LKENINTDLTIIGGGFGGYVAGVTASKLGLKVVLVEKKDLGGTCVNRGCIPTKTLLHISKMLYESTKLKEYDIEINISDFNYLKMLKKTNQVASELSNHIENLMEKNNIKVIKGFGKLKNHKTVIVKKSERYDLTINSPKIIIATGSSPFVPPIKGVDQKGIFTTDDIFHHYKKPSNVIIIGAGATGLEFGTIFNNIGSKVTILEMLPNILPKEEVEISDYLKQLLEEQGIKIFSSIKITNIKKIEDELIVQIENGKKIHGDLVLLATGRIPNSKGLGLEELVDFNNGRIIVNNKMKTKTENIFAIGDVVGRWDLAHVAMHEGIVAGENAAGKDNIISYKAIPRCVYTEPQVAFTGLSEREAEDLNIYNVKTIYYPLRAIGRSLTINKEKGFIKIVYEDKYKEILGVQLVAPEASELIEEISLAINVEATLENLATTIHAHPTLSEIIWEGSLKGLGKGIHL